MASDREYIAYFRTRVEQELMIGTSGGKLKQRDFEYLARQIEEKSKVRLSLSTLKRLWKDDYMQEPHASTLDAAVSILGYDSWQTFKKQQAESLVQKSPIDTKRQVRSFVWPIAGTLLAVLVLIAFFVIQGFNRSEKKLEIPDNITFTADKTITSGVPNTVVFTYDVRDVKADSFFIQQSWNPLNKVRIDPSRNYLSSIYYTPGFHRAKLIVNDSIVRTARIHVKTDGWLPILQYDIRDNSPYYLDPRKMFVNGTMVTNHQAFSAANVDVTKRFFLRYYNIRDFDGVDSDNFSIEARFKHDSIPTVICPLAELTILTEEHIYFVPMTSRGCVGELEIKIGEVYQTSRDHNLSGLGTNIYEWQKLRIENTNKSATVFLNDTEAIQIQYNRDFGKIVGLIFSFNGPGSVDYITMTDVKGKTVYSDDFQRAQSHPAISGE
jgi:hypothetical protein